ncbi:ABC transporter permease [Gaiella sp.]|jgi:ribose transport system permease protein|uniref:ABC transporter permease n=1 Tax=Gaiella sp. TaxID=2663207 RepID=UPI002E32EE96|nr:ABC transporter permease [Gaiella sp.]HEX5584291.1 ABC transporter permease [Gaiella sp.]
MLLGVLPPGFRRLVTAAGNPARGGAPRTSGRSAPLVASAVVAARFVPIWLATAALFVVAAIIAPNALKSTSWAFVLPSMTILAIAALGQMLVIMHAGIDLSTPGVISLGGNFLVGVSAGSNHRLALGILACIGIGALAGLVNGIFVAILRLNPLIVTLAVGQILLAWTVRYSRSVTNQSSVPEALSTWASHKPLGISAVFWTGAAITLAVALMLRYAAPGRRFQAVGANPRAAWMAGLQVRSHVVFAYVAAGTLYGVAAVLLAGFRISIDPAFGAAYLLAPIAAVVIAGASLSGGLASATSTWMAALALTLLTQMLLILGLSTAMQYVVFGAAIIVGMLISGDRLAALLGRVLRPVDATAGVQTEVGAYSEVTENTS